MKRDLSAEDDGKGRREERDNSDSDRQDRTNRKGGEGRAKDTRRQDDDRHDKTEKGKGGIPKERHHTVDGYGLPPDLPAQHDTTNQRRPPKQSKGKQNPGKQGRRGEARSRSRGRSRKGSR